MNFNHSNSNNDKLSEESRPIFRAARITSCKSDECQISQTKYFKRSLSSPESYHKEQRMMKKETNSGGSRWSVTQSCPVPLVGLDRKAVLVHDSAKTVSERIDQSLRARSVQAQFDNARAEASCTTSTSLHYMINLFAGPEGSTYVEVRKMRGCSWSFRTEREAAINAATNTAGSAGSAGSLGGKRLQTPSVPKLVIPQQLRSLYVCLSHGELIDILNRASDQFHSQNRHTVLFALQNVVSMTTADKVHQETAHDMSKLIIQNQSDIRDILVTMYINEARNTGDDVSMQICSAVLRILINGIFALSASGGKNDGFLDGECKYFVEQLVPCLVESAGSYEFPHHTCLALNCLCLLTKKSSLACAKAREINAGSIIEQAELYGKREHLKLEEAARSTLSFLQSEIMVI